MKTTPFTHFHEELGARMAPFAGYNMPIEYTGIKDEHNTVREKLGVFDVSHMGEKHLPDHKGRKLHEAAICCSRHIFSRIHYMAHHHNR